MTSLAKNFLSSAAKRSAVPMARSYLRRTPTYDGRTPTSVEYEETYYVRPNRARQEFTLKQPSSYSNQLAGVPSNSLADPDPHYLAVRAARRPIRRSAPPLRRRGSGSLYDGRTPTSVDFDDYRRSFSTQAAGRGYHAVQASSPYDGRAPTSVEYEDLIFGHKAVAKPSSVRGYPRPVSAYDGRTPTSVEYEEAYDPREATGGKAPAKPDGKRSA